MASIAPVHASTVGVRRVRLLFVIVLLLFVAQLVVTDGRREPYPALFLPSFGNGSVTPEGTVTGPEGAVVATYSDGTSARFDDLEVMGEARSSPRRSFRSAFEPKSLRRLAPATAEWLENRLYELGGRHPESAVVEWYEVAYDLDGEVPPRSTLVDRTVIFGDDRG